MFVNKYLPYFKTPASIIMYSKLHFNGFCFLLLDILPKKKLVTRESSSRHKIRTVGSDGHRYVALTRGKKDMSGDMSGAQQPRTVRLFLNFSF